MAARKRLWPDGRAARLNALERVIEKPRSDDEPTIVELLAALAPDAQKIVGQWLKSLPAPFGSADSALVCCERHGIRRVYAALRDRETLSAADLNRIEEENTCRFHP